MKPSNIGGQAVMEGIMMRHKDKYSIAVRRPDKEIEVKVEDYKCIFGKARIWRKPIIRGMVSFIDSLVTGTKCLMYSAEIAGDEEDEEETRKNAALSSEELEVKKKKEDKAFKALLYVTVAVSIVISIAAFMLLPYALASLCRKVGASEVVVTIVEAFVKLIPEYGRYDDLMCLFGTECEAYALAAIKEQLEKDLKNMEEGKPISLLGKWLPSCNASSKQTKKNGTVVRTYLGLSEKNYRKILSKLREYIKIVERQMSAKEWGKINYEAVPSRANLIYNDAFLRNDEERRREYLGSLEKGEAKINASVLFPALLS